VNYTKYVVFYGNLDVCLTEYTDTTHERACAASETNAEANFRRARNTGEAHSSCRGTQEQRNETTVQG